jgi:hypothetical protein
MPVVAVECPRCRTPLDWASVNQPGFASCTACSSRVQAEVFPAFFRELAPVRDAESILVEGESTCFYHTDRKALLPCQSCGRFICALCDCELRGEHFCAACLEAGKKKGKIRNLNNVRTKYDSMALSLAILPMLFFYATLITAPLTLIVSYRHWNSPLGIGHKTRTRFVIAMIVAFLQICGWVVLFIFLAQLFYGS